MKKTIIAAMLAIATFVSFSAQAQTTSDEGKTKTEQCQKKECKKECKDKKDCKKGMKDCKDKKGCKKGGKDKKDSKDFKCHKGDRRGFDKNRGSKQMLFKGIELNDEQRAQLKDARINAKKGEQQMMDSQIQTILTPEQYTIFQQNKQNLEAAKAQKKAEMQAKRAERKAMKGKKSEK